MTMPMIMMMNIVLTFIWLCASTLSEAPMFNYHHQKMGIVMMMMVMMMTILACFNKLVSWVIYCMPGRTLGAHYNSSNRLVRLPNLLQEQVCQSGNPAQAIYCNCHNCHSVTDQQQQILCEFILKSEFKEQFNLRYIIQAHQKQQLYVTNAATKMEADRRLRDFAPFSVWVTVSAAFVSNSTMIRNKNL